MKKIIFLIVFSLSIFSQAQNMLEIGAVIQESKLTNFNQQKLLLIDFWATWCAPCIPAGEQLEVYQSQLPNDIYLIGISDENEFKIKRFVEKYGLKMAIYQDFNQYNVREYNVSYRPFSIILNNKGKLLWQGSPSDLNVNFLRNLSRKQTYRDYQLNDIFKFNSKIESQQISNIDTLDIYVEKLTTNYIESQFVKTDKRVYFEGKLVNFYSKLFEKPLTSFNSDMNLKIKFGSTLGIWNNDKERIQKEVEEQFEVQLIQNSKSISALELIISDNTKLWDRNQIVWGDESSSNHLIGENRIEADNLTLKDICNILSDVKKTPYIYSGTNTEQYDWNFHYLYDNFMVDELDSQFGIKISEPKLIETDIYTIKKSNP